MQQEMMEQALAWIRSRCFGKYRGVVVEDNDPTHRGRLKVRVPAVLGAVQVWAMPCVPYAGEQVGFFSLPSPGAGVWVEFEAGDPSFPIWVGCFWASEQLPASWRPAQKMWQTQGAHLQLDAEHKRLRAVCTKGARLELESDAVVRSGDCQQRVARDEIVMASQGAGRVEVSRRGVTVNRGALEVSG